MYHGILLNKSFKDNTFLLTYKSFSTKVFENSDWIVYGIEINDKEIENQIKLIQKNMIRGKYFNHVYNDERLVIIYKDKIFDVTSHISSWKNAIEYGKSLGIDEDQLNFWPNRFQDEVHYFN
ncbi:MAG: hypothetical protein Q9M91_07855 [Candidatus Dojkabacteria bacterium]|nr:hypothetical protein [Candidatus Dojkabacteria bacterium]